VVALNLGAASHDVEVRSFHAGRVLVSTGLDPTSEEVSGTISLRGNEGVVVEVDG
jgi:hypothetical protein